MNPKQSSDQIECSRFDAREGMLACMVSEHTSTVAAQLQLGKLPQPVPARAGFLKCCAAVLQRQRPERCQACVAQQWDHLFIAARYVASRLGCNRTAVRDLSLLHHPTSNIMQRKYDQDEQKSGKGCCGVMRGTGQGQT